MDLCTNPIAGTGDRDMDGNCGREFVVAAAAAGDASVTRYAVAGMTCGACARHVEAALESLPGVLAAHVDFTAGSAVIEADGAPPSFEAMRQVVSSAGYTLDYGSEQARHRDFPVQPIVLGVLALAGLLTVYLGLITLAQSWSHAVEQLSEDRWFVAAISIGFGTQVGLFAYLRWLHGTAAAGGVAASTGTSTAAMLACCAHHLTDILPMIGVAGVAVFLNVYKTPFLWLGIVMNVFGIAYMAWQIRRQCSTVRAAGSGPRVAPSTTDSSSVLGH
jgi:copper chaperone CopZ